MTRRYVRRNTNPEDFDNLQGFETAKENEDDLSLDNMLSDTMRILRKEVKNLKTEAARGLLSRDSSQALVNYTKLLKELKREEKELLDNLSDEELEAAATKKE